MGLVENKFSTYSTSWLATYKWVKMDQVKFVEDSL